MSMCVCVCVCVCVCGVRARVVQCADRRRVASCRLRVLPLLLLRCGSLGYSHKREGAVPRDGTPYGTTIAANRKVLS